MRTDILIHRFLIMCIAFLLSSFVALNALALQSKSSLEPRIYSCDELKKLYPELDKLSHKELKKSLFEKFLSQYRTCPMENYTYAKYYVCCFHNDNSEQVNYLRKWVAAFEKKLKSKGN